MFVFTKGKENLPKKNCTKTNAQMCMCKSNVVGKYVINWHNYINKCMLRAILTLSCWLGERPTHTQHVRQCTIFGLTQFDK